jgi:hypothetical protein
VSKEIETALSRPTYRSIVPSIADLFGLAKDLAGVVDADLTRAELGRRMTG